METEYKSQALKDFEKAWVTLQWTAMTDAQRNTYLRTYLGLQIESAKEAEANKVEAEQQALIQQAARTAQITQYMQSEGFACDNSEQDWDKLYNKPTVFGENWKTISDYQRSLSLGVEDFMNHAYNLWLEVKDQ